MECRLKWDSWRDTQLEQIEQALDQWLRPERLRHDGCEAPEALVEVLRYAVLGGGKRLRPLLVLASCGAFSSDKTQLEVALHAACAVEIIHAYSLVHDDMPCMDDDDLRRGQPTVHVRFGEALALLAGDTLQALAFEWLTVPSIPAVVQAKLCALLARAIGASGMAGGQAVDLMSVGKTMSPDELRAMHHRKTGALLKACVQMGAVCAGRAAYEPLDGYGRAIGLAFQVVDDVLDATQEAGVLGKTAGKDAANNKPTYVSIWGIDQSRSFANTLYQEAISALDHMQVDLGSSVNTERLHDLAIQVIQRQY